MPSEMKFLDPAIIQLLRKVSTELEDVPDDAAKLALRGKLEKVLKFHFEQAKLLFVPVNAGGHWTLLVLEKKGDEFEARYYDTLQEQSLVCHTEACRTAGLLLDADFLVLDKRNCQGQNKWSCGFTTCWYIEEEARQIIGEGWASRGWKSDVDVRAQLHKLLVALSAEHEKMEIEHEQAQATFHARQAAAKKLQDKKSKIDLSLQYTREQAWLGMNAFEEGAAMPKVVEKAETASSSKDVDLMGIEEKPEETSETIEVRKIEDHFEEARGCCREAYSCSGE